MKNINKGFTLIELIAVILILGIIALIAIPTVNSIVKQANKEAFKSSVEQIVKSTGEKCQTQLIKDEMVTTTYNFSEAGVTPKLDIKGSLPTNGSITLDNNCNISSVNVSNSKYAATLDGDEIKVTISTSGGGIIAKVWSLTNDDNKNGNADIGDEITVGTETFYVISNTDGNIKALAKYNLYVGEIHNRSGYSELEPTGLQDSNMRGWVSGQTEKYGITVFSNDSQKGVNYSDYDGSIVQKYVNTYKTKLNESGANISEASLIKKEELKVLGCNLSSNSCTDSSYPWVYSTSYWSNEAFDTTSVWVVYSDGTYNDSGYYSDYNLGVRPVIKISASEI